MIKTCVSPTQPKGNIAENRRVRTAAQVLCIGISLLMAASPAGLASVMLPQYSTVPVRVSQEEAAALTTLEAADSHLAGISSGMNASDAAAEFAAIVLLVGLCVLVVALASAQSDQK